MSPDRQRSGATRIEADLSIKRGETNLMRRASICLALLGLVALGAPAVAAAEEVPTPTVSLKAKAVAIPGFGVTGNFYGKGADVEAEFEITGSGYGATPADPKGSPPPISAVNFYLPKGTKLDQKDFKTACSEEILKNTGPVGCPKPSIASPVGSVLGEVTFGATRVEESATLQAFFGPGGGLLFFVHGSSPVNLEIISAGKYKKSSGKYAWELETLVPAVESVRGAPDASTSKIHIKAGAAKKVHGKTVSYGTIPKKGECPKGGFPIKAEVFFGGTYGGEREFGIPVKSVTDEIKTPCPKH
jgi:hypothetical protein